MKKKKMSDGRLTRSFSVSYHEEGDGHRFQWDIPFDADHEERWDNLGMIWLAIKEKEKE